jgi:hypothetical protein
LDPRTPEEMLAITNKYALEEEVTLDNRDTKKDKVLCKSDLPDTSKNTDKKRKPYCSMAKIEWLRHNSTEYRPWPGEFEGSLDMIFIFYPRKNIRLGTMTDCKGLQMKS